MKRNLLGIALAVCVLAGASYAQVRSSNVYNHGEIGAFANYTRLSNANDTNFYGLGGRLGMNIMPAVQLEAEGAYDFERNVTVSTSGVSTVSSGLRMAHFMFGPKFQFGGSSPVRVFGTVKGGLINFSTNTNFGSQVTNIPHGNTDGVLYPAGGIEFFAGWFGMRFEAGDEIYFDFGRANNNLRVTAGPVIRF